jgi:hypothetical protein
LPELILPVAVALLIFPVVSDARVAVIVVAILDFIAAVSTLTLYDELVVDNELPVDPLLKTWFEPEVLCGDELDDADGADDCNAVATTLTPRSLGVSTTGVEAVAVEGAGVEAIDEPVDG